MQCEMCRKDAVCIAEIEGSQLSVCDGCASFGKLIRKLSATASAPTRAVRSVGGGSFSSTPEKIETIFSDYGSRIRKAREKMGLNQEDFAKKLNEKVSEIHTFESSHREPSIDQARKLERLLHIQLVEVIEVKPEVSDSGKKAGGLTIGDILKIK